MSRNRLCNIPSWKMELQVSHLAWFQMTVFPSEAIKVTESSDFSVMPSAAVSGELCTSGHLSHAVPGRGRPRLCPCRGRWGQQSPVLCPSPEPASRAAASPQTPRVTAADTAGSGAPGYRQQERTGRTTVWGQRGKSLWDSSLGAIWRW